MNLVRPERPTFPPTCPPASGPLPLLAGGRRAHPLTDQEAVVIASCLFTCAGMLAGDDRAAASIGALRRQILVGIGERP